MDSIRETLPRVREKRDVVGYPPAGGRSPKRDFYENRVAYLHRFVNDLSR